MSTLLEVKNLSIKSPDKTIISDLSFQVNEGDFVSIKGPSGSGKSTLLRQIAYLNSDVLTQEGQILYKGKATDQYPPIELRQEISYCFQTAQLFGQTVWDNLSFPYHIRKQEVDQKKITLYMKELNLPENYLQQEIGNLSGGEKQRIALIRNLLFTPKIILLDEVTSALDEESRKILWTWLTDHIQKEEITTLLISHLESDHQFANQTVEIKMDHENKEEV